MKFQLTESIEIIPQLNNHLTFRYCVYIQIFDRISGIKENSHSTTIFEENRFVHQIEYS